MIMIGQTREIYHDDKYPSIMKLINKPIKDKDKVLSYMKRCQVDAAAPAILRDVINPDYKIPELLLMSDGTYGWRSDVIYYVEKYDMALPEDFIAHVLNKVK
jgi:hypothetical protein